MAAQHQPSNLLIPSHPTSPQNKSICVCSRGAHEGPYSYQSWREKPADTGKSSVPRSFSPLCGLGEKKPLEIKGNNCNVSGKNRNEITARDSQFGFLNETAATLAWLYQWSWLQETAGSLASPYDGSAWSLGDNILAGTVLSHPCAALLVFWKA